MPKNVQKYPKQPKSPKCISTATEPQVYAAAAAAVVAWLTRRGARTFASWHLRRNEFQFATAADPSVADRRGKGVGRTTSKRSSLGRFGCRFGGI